MASLAVLTSWRATVYKGMVSQVIGLPRLSLGTTNSKSTTLFSMYPLELDVISEGHNDIGDYEVQRLLGLSQDFRPARIPGQPGQK